MSEKGFKYYKRDNGIAIPTVSDAKAIFIDINTLIRTRKMVLAKSGYYVCKDTVRTVEPYVGLIKLIESYVSHFSDPKIYILHFNMNNKNSDYARDLFYSVCSASTKGTYLDIKCSDPLSVFKQYASSVFDMLFVSDEIEVCGVRSINSDIFIRELIDFLDKKETEELVSWLE